NPNPRPASAQERRERDREHPAPAAALVIQLTLVLTDDAIGHEEPEPGSGLFGREMRLEQGGTGLGGDAWSVVGHAEIGPAVRSSSGGKLDVAMLRCGIDGVVDEV